MGACCPKQAAGTPAIASKAASMPEDAQQGGPSAAPWTSASSSTLGAWVGA